MARIRILTLCLLPLLFIGCSDDDDPVKPFADFDRTARFLEDSQPIQIIGDAVNDDRARDFIENNAEISVLLDELSAFPYYAKPTGEESAASRDRIRERVPLGQDKAGFGGPSAPYGTYVLSLGEWVLDDPDVPTDSALFLFSAEDGITYENAQGLIVLVEGELEYSYQELVNTETDFDASETIEIRIAEAGLPLKGTQLETILRFYDRLYGALSETELFLGIERGDRSAASRTASARTSWIGNNMLYSEASNHQFMDGADEVGEYRIAIQYYSTLIDGLLHYAEGVVERTPPASEKVETSLLEIGFGLTSTPAVIPWLLLIEEEVGVDFDVYTGEIRFRGRRAGDIDGTSNPVTCEPCDPPATCDDIWVTWTNDADNPVLLCTLAENLGFFF